MKITDEYAALLRTSGSVDTLVKAARYASEKYIDPLTARWGEQGRHAAVFDLCEYRLRELEHREVARLLRQEHKARLALRDARQAVDRAVDRITPDPDDED